MATSDKLTSQQELFAQNIAKGMNNVDAYVNAGYKAKSNKAIRVGSTRLRQSAKIQARLRELAEESRAPNILDRQRIQAKLTEFALRIPQSDDVVPTVNEAIKAMEMLGRLQGLFIDKQQLEVKGALPVVISNDVTE